jgi:phosphoribosylanthranilate isomerase
MMRPQIKICGMKHNVTEVAGLHPEYLGFIFYDKSPRNFTGEIPNISGDISRVGVFVNATLNFINECISKHHLKVIQLHGDETPEFCKELRGDLLLSGNESIQLWKVFHIRDKFDFGKLTPYESHVDAFLFDTKGTSRGGNGIAFNWKVLGEYSSEKPFILSGGIGQEEVEKVKDIIRTGLPIVAVDINSRFEREPGLKDIKMLKRFIDELSRE